MENRECKRTCLRWLSINVLQRGSRVDQSQAQAATRRSMDIVTEGGKSHNSTKDHCSTKECVRELLSFLRKVVEAN